MADYLTEIRAFIDITGLSYSQPEPVVEIIPEYDFDTIEPVLDFDSFYDDLEELRQKLINYSCITDSPEFNEGYDEATHKVVSMLNRILQKYHNGRNT